MKEYLVVPFNTGFFSGAFHPVKFQDLLNAHGRMGWSFSKSIHEQRRILFFFSREAHFVIFSRDIDGIRPVSSYTSNPFS